MAIFRDFAVGNEAALPGNTRPPKFKSAGHRPGGPFTFDWYAAYTDDDGSVIAGGTVVVQWYGVEFSGDQVTTPELGDAEAVEPLAVKTKSVGDGMWPWCQVTGQVPPVGATRIRIYLTASAVQQSEVDTSVLEAMIGAVADDTVEQLNTGDSGLSRVEASASAALAAAGLTLPADLLVAYGTLGFGETQSWLVQPSAGQQVNVYRLRLVQGSAGAVQLYEGSALNSGLSNTIDALLPLGAGAVWAEADPFMPLWTTASDNGLIVERANQTTTIGYRVHYTLT